MALNIFKLYTRCNDILYYVPALFEYLELCGNTTSSSFDKWERLLEYITLFRIRSRVLNPTARFQEAVQYNIVVRSRSYSPGDHKVVYGVFARYTVPVLTL